MGIFDRMKQKVMETFGGEEKMVQSYKGKFKKKDGSIREMRWISYKDAIDNKLVNPPKTQKRVNRSEGEEVVYDLDRKQLRSFNHNTKIGEIEMSTTSLK